MALYVYKFGGTSVGTVERIKAVAEKVKRAQDAGDLEAWWAVGVDANLHLVQGFETPSNSCLASVEIQRN